MTKRLRRCRHQRGVTFVDLLVGGLLMAIGLMGLVGTWLFSFTVTANTDDTQVAYNLARYVVEQVKMAGYTIAEGTSTSYYDGNQNGVASSSSANRYTVTQRIVSAQVDSGTPGQSGAVPSDGTLRTVSVAVSLSRSGTVLYQTGTYLIKKGI